ncbi:MAG: hypothetical protein JO214_00640 [Frankiaceae bacterium]|nr:hypothetical protein [Frankiaceae bacterium]
MIAVNTRLFLAGALVLIAGLASDTDGSWVVWAFGLAMIVASLLPRVFIAAYHREEQARHRAQQAGYWPFTPPPRN